jgi:SET and MYND domain-containing protein
VLRNIAAQESTENKSDCSLRAKVDDLEAHETELSDDERNHMGAVIAVARRLVHGRAQLVNEREQKLLLSFSTDYMIMMVSRMKTNGFSICDGENVAIGVGLFDVASNMNHSCRPNALQTFSYTRQGVLPTIRITACTAISSRDEICISYIDNGCPRDMRRKRLQEGYHFWCTCSACRDDNHDDRIVGVCCPKARCHGIGKRLSHLDSRPSEWVCDKCGNSDFCKATELMRSLHDNYRSKMSIEEQENLYAEFRSGFSASSWYVCEAGEQLAQSLLDATNGGSDQETRRLCARALAVLDQLLAASNSAFENDAWKVLRNRVILYKAAKLRLFLYPDPRVALTELRRTLEVLCIYYPKDHEFLLGLENTMAQAMY